MDTLCSSIENEIWTPFTRLKLWPTFFYRGTSVSDLRKQCTHERKQSKTGADQRVCPRSPFFPFSPWLPICFWVSTKHQIPCWFNNALPWKQVWTFDVCFILCSSEMAWHLSQQISLTELWENLCLDYNLHNASEALQKTKLIRTANGIQENRSWWLRHSYPISWPLLCLVDMIC